MQLMRCDEFLSVEHNNWLTYSLVEVELWHLVMM